ncbi:MAG: hypothetical protein GVY17_07600 [Cyanobacteria bacterium]|jgi:hypothetical protein|nr:hypothetical protein [Cyanobacteria bacterium GSL.Bin21]
MTFIVEINETGTLQLPEEVLQAIIPPHTRFQVEVTSDKRLTLSHLPPEQPFWATATPEEQVERFMEWVRSRKNGANLPDEALRRENIN